MLRMLAMCRCALFGYVMCIVVSMAGFLEAHAAHGERQHTVDAERATAGAAHYAYGYAHRRQRTQDKRETHGRGGGGGALSVKR